MNNLHGLKNLIDLKISFYKIYFAQINYSAVENFPIRLQLIFLKPPQQQETIIQEVLN